MPCACKSQLCVWNTHCCLSSYEGRVTAPARWHFWEEPPHAFWKEAWFRKCAWCAPGVRCKRSAISEPLPSTGLPRLQLQKHGFSDLLGGPLGLHTWSRDVRTPSGSHGSSPSLWRLRPCQQRTWTMGRGNPVFSDDLAPEVSKEQTPSYWSQWLG